MVEPRVMLRAAGGGGGFVNEDVYDSAYTEIQPVDETSRGLLGLNSFQWPVNYNAA